MEQSFVPLSLALMFWAGQIIFLILWTKLCFSFRTSKRRKIPSSFGKPKVLHKDNYPFDEGEPIDWYHIY